MLRNQLAMSGNGPKLSAEESLDLGSKQVFPDNQHYQDLWLRNQLAAKGQGHRLSAAENCELEAAWWQRNLQSRLERG